MATERITTERITTEPTTTEPTTTEPIPMERDATEPITTERLATEPSTALAIPTNDGSRTKRAPRCPACWLPVRCCVCADLPRLQVATRVVIVMHHVEGRRASNTGRLAAKILGAEIRLRGAPSDHGAAPRAAMPEGKRFVLFPAESARVLRADDARDGPIVLVVPDGNWRQASRVLSRDEAAIGAEAVTLPPGAPSRYRLRRRHNEAALSTFEAIARALAILETPSIEAEMMRALDLFVERTLALRGGIPAIGFEAATKESAAEPEDDD